MVGFQQGSMVLDGLSRQKVAELAPQARDAERVRLRGRVATTQLSEDMKKLADAHRLARRTAVVIRQNLIFSISAMLVLVTSGLFLDLPLPLAVIGHEGGTVLVVLNGLRLLSDRIRHNVAETSPHRRLGHPGAPAVLPQTSTASKLT